MILTCPSCSARYFTEEKALGPRGREVKCASCGHVWHAAPENPLDLEPVYAPPEDALTRDKVERMRRGDTLAPHERVRRQALEKQGRQRFAQAMGVWVVAFGLLAVTLGSAIMARRQIVSIWPKSGSVFAAIGLKVNIYGLDFADVSATRVFENAVETVAVRGRIVNISRQDRRLPDLLVRLVGAKGQALATWTQGPPKEVLAPGEDVLFEASWPMPPPDGFDVKVRFRRVSEAPIPKPTFPMPGAENPALRGSDELHAGPAMGEIPADDAQGDPEGATSVGAGTGAPDAHDGEVGTKHEAGGGH